VGSMSYNMDLSQERAASVRQFLEMSGIEGTRLLPIGHGKNQPIATNKTEDGRQLNRRVEFQLTTKSPEHTALQSR
ncbi:MAG: OmpA family protein, partial [Flavobacteriales bacterium]|nr:OmpA family protein [Flavobacteriales bacterium]